MVQVKSKILYKQRITDRHFHFVIDGVSLIKDSCPGKFLEIKINNTNEPLLRRPFGIHRVCGNNLEIFIEVVGKATQILSNKKEGEYLDVIGPLGNGFDCRMTRDEERKMILVAGGMGVAPLLFLAERLMVTEPRTPNPEPIILIGAKTKEYLFCEKEFKVLGCEIKIATDDGSKGYSGRVTDLLKSVLRGTKDERRRTIYACGPKPMLKEITLISMQHNIPAQVSLEAHMACGIGVCLGCVVNTIKGVKRICKEGPVFNADELIWEG